MAAAKRFLIRLAARPDNWLLVLFGLFTAAAVGGYAVFGLNPQLLSRDPALIEFYGIAFELFAQAHVWLAAVVLAIVLWRHAGRAWLPALAVVYGLSFLAEYAGTTWGIPFGGYRYTELLGPKLAGQVPVLIPLSWFLMALPAYLLARRLLDGAPAWLVLVCGSALLVAWDLALDPAMSGLSTYWIWSETGPYYGMPWLNLWGWFVTGLALMAALHWSRAADWGRGLSHGWLASYFGLQVAMPMGMLVAAGAWTAVAATFVAFAGLILGGLALRRPAAEQDPEPQGPRGGGTPLEPLDGPAWQEGAELTRQGLDAAARRLAAEGMPRLQPEGQLIRPLAAYGAALGLGFGPQELDERFWNGVLAIQLAHEASLVHDDVIDRAPQRRGRPTMYARQGAGPALVYGDHLLTAAYRAAAATGSMAFVAAFARAVERTVAGEIAQARAQGEVLGLARYDQIVRGKSGELFAVALAGAGLIFGRGDADRQLELGRELGRSYQMLDDLLDFCPRAETGKAALMDLEQDKWTWPLHFLGGRADRLPGRDAATLLFSSDAAGGLITSPMRRALGYYDGQLAVLARELQLQYGRQPLLQGILSGWQARARAAVRSEEEALGLPAGAAAGVLTAELAELRQQADWNRYFARHSRSFRFAAWWFPTRLRRQVAGVYAFCRFSDDLVDGHAELDAEQQRRMLNAWQSLASQAYYGQGSGVPLLDRVMADMRDQRVPFRYVHELLQGMDSDRGRVRIADGRELKRYTYRVASVVGLWLSRLAGIEQGRLLQRAEALGHAMQLTNILRDVGEDLARDRIYLPANRLRAHGLDEATLRAMAAGEQPRSDAYRALIEELLTEAEAAYAEAFAVMHELPGAFGRAVAVAAAVYRGIHEQIRAADYDNLRRRARTGRLAKMRLATAALWRLWRQRRDPRQPHLDPVRSLEDQRAGGRLRALGVTAGLALLFGLSAPAPAAAAADPYAQGLDRLAQIENRIELRGPSRSLELERLRTLFFLGVEELRWVEAGAAAVERLQTRYGLTGSSPTAALVRAYAGSLELLRAKHAWRPRQKLAHLEAGLAQLDAQVAAYSEQAEIRYVRLMSCYYLPFFFGRGDSVKADFRALARLLPAAQGQYPQRLYANTIRFVLENHDELDPGQRRALEGALPSETAAAAAPEFGS